MKKVQLLLKVAIAFVFAFVLSLNLAVNKAMALGNFSQTCYDISISGGTLSAICAKADGYTPNQTSINLDSYIGNLDGTLSWGDSRFSLTCEGISVSNSLLNANCEKRDGYTLVPTNINLDQHIANIDGTLKYE